MAPGHGKMNRVKAFEPKFKKAKVVIDPYFSPARHSLSSVGYLSKTRNLFFVELVVASDVLQQSKTKSSGRGFCERDIVKYVGSLNKSATTTKEGEREIR